MTDDDKVADYLRRATVDLRAARARIRELESAPIAVVGMACRLPGGVDSPERLWELLDRGGETLSAFPTDRGWDLDALYHPDPDRAGTSYVDRAGFLDDAAGFDAGFFGISPREATAMDPQQRLLLETGWELVENAGIDPHSLRGTDTGVFLGVARFGYGEGESTADTEGWSVTGVAPSVASGRLSYALGLEGPSVSLDTACSSSLVALHLAVESLRRGESSLAVVGGAAVMGTPDVFVDFSRQRALAADGRSKSFGAGADGFGFSEGVSLVLVERLADARRLGHDVLAVVRGSAVNQDGRSNGLAAPSGAAQRKLIRGALRASGLEPSDVDVVEAHGTGTALGDPIEADALLGTYGRDRGSAGPLWLGSVKSNLGHTQAAAGVTGLLKIVLSMRHERMPRTLHVDEPTPHVDWSAGTVRLLADARPWVRGERTRRAAVSAFGISGTNAHVVVEEALAADPADGSPDGPVHDGRPVPLVVSARDAAALRARARQVADLLADSDPDLARVALGSAVAARHEHRAVVVASTREQGRERLAEVAAGTAPAGGAVMGVAETAARTVVFLFPGQGSQWSGMGAALLESAPVFAEAVRECDEAMAPWRDERDPRVVDVLRGEPGTPGLDRVDVVQPALFAVMVGLARLWRSYGVEPAAVAGHSQGEIAAAHVAGVLDLADAAALVTVRSRLLRSLSGTGGMAAVELDEAAVWERVRPWAERIAVAAVNGPRSVVVSGDPGALQEFGRACDADGVRVRVVDVDYASHSPHIDGVRDELLRRVSEVRPRPGRVPFYSTVDTRVVDGAELDASYWYRNLREPVRFADTVTLLAEAGYDAFVEVSPHPVVTQPVAEVVEDVAGVDETVVVGTLARDRGDLEAFLWSVATAHVSGVAVDWSAATPGAVPARLPAYPFRRDRYWLRPRTAANVNTAVHRVSWRPLGTLPAVGLDGHWLVAVPDDAPPWTGELCAALAAAGAQVVGGTPGAGPRDVEAAGLRGVLALPPAGPVAAPDVAATTVTLLRELGDAGVDAPVWCLTQGAVRASGDRDLPRPELAAVHGVAHSARVELAGRWGGVLDLPDPVDGDVARLVVAALGVEGEDVLAVRGGRVLGRRLAPATLARPDEEWSPHGTVLVTGAAGPVGGRLARRLAERGATTLVLAGPDPGADLLAAIGEAGARAVVCAAEPAAVRAAVGDGPLVALVHAGTLPHLERLRDVDPGALATSVATTGAPATWVDELLGGERVEREIFCTSVAGVWGGTGMAAYAAASAHLDALAEHRRARGHACTAVAWTPWAVPDSAVDDGHLRELGLRPLPPERALDVWDRVLAADPSPLVVADADWAAFEDCVAAVAPTALFAELAGSREPAARTGAGTDGGTDGGEGPASALAQLPPEQLRDTLGELVTTTVAEVLGHATVAEVAPRRAFSELGLDSLGATALRRQLAGRTGLSLPASLVFDHPTVTALVDHLHRVLAGTAAAERPAPMARAGDESEPVAIVGIGCRLPGGVGSPDELWQLLLDGTDAITGFPTDRGWDVARLHHPEPGHPGTSYVNEGGFLSGVADFDAGFFGITPREALAMDPQQRLALETAWEAVEHAGIDPDTLRGTDTGVYVGTNGQSYSALVSAEGSRVDGYQGLGSAPSVLSGRIAYTFGWEGPALTVDTACSSSLVAIHLAAQALRRGECSLALAGGVTVMSDPYTFVDFSSQRGLAPDGRCKAFSAGADGFALSDGVAALVLEPLSRARANGHRVLAVLRGSAVNQDGASNGLAAPNGPSQERVIRAALAASGLAAADVDAVEAHGTGTELGDPIEAGALEATYGRDRDRPLWLGSLKTNIGHSQAAAGAAGVIKIVLALRNGLLPRSLHAQELTPHVDWESSPLDVAREPVPWPAGERPRRAGVSSFGVSGTNAHLIVEEAPAEPDAAEPDPDDGVAPGGPLPFLLSGRSEDVVRQQARLLSGHLRARPDIGLVDVARTLATGRTRFDVRAAVLGDDRAGVCHALDALAEDRPAAGVVGPEAATARRPVLVFPGQGSQWAGMGRELLEGSAPFAEAMRECANALGPHVDWDLLDVVRGRAGAGVLERVDVVQPVLFAVMVSLARVWRSFGVVPSAVVGHSQGEIAAACVAGGLSLRDAARLVAVRSRILREIDTRGGMVSVTASHAELEPVLEHGGGAVTVAAQNGPRAFVVAGTAAELDDVVAAAGAAGMDPHRIAVGYASHSPDVERVEAQLAAELGTVTAVSGTVPLYSTVTGELLDTAGMDAAYWYRNLRRPVLFEQAVRAALGAGHDTVVEVSPHPVLSTAVEDVAGDAGRPVVVVPSLRRDRGGPGDLLQNVLRASVHGVGVDPAAFVAGGRPVDLPTYPFEHRRYWPRPHRSTDAATTGVRDTRHPLLLAAVDVPGHGGAVFTGRLDTDEQPWLAEHVVDGRTLVPGSVLVELALSAGTDAGVSVLEELVLHRPLVLTGSATLVRVSVGAADEHGRRGVDVHAAEAGAGPDDVRWTLHASGTLAEDVPAGGRDTGPWPPPGATAVPVEDHYETLAELGYEYGPAFRALRAAWRAGETVYAEVATDERRDGYTVDPVLLDAVAQTLGLRSAEPGRLPFAWNGVAVHATGAGAVRVVATPAGPDAVSLRVIDPAGLPVLTVDSLVVRDAGGPADAPMASGDGALRRLRWTRVPDEDTGATPVVEAADASADGLDRALRDAGSGAVVVRYRPDGESPDAAARHGVRWAAGLVGLWSERDPSGCTLVVATSGGVRITAADGPPEPGAAAVWGVMRAAQAESPDRFVLVDGEPLNAPVTQGHPQLAVRDGDVVVPRLEPWAAAGPGRPDRTRRLAPGAGSTDSLVLEPAPDAERALAENEVRIAVRAGGVNFRDVLLALGEYPEPAAMGTEAAGVVTDVGPGVDRFGPGDAVLGLFSGAHASLAVTDHRLLAPVPPGWTHAGAAAVPIAFTTAHYALHDLAGLRAGQTVLVHAAAGGVGTAAVAIARRLGAEVYATAAPAKHAVLRGLGLDDDHIASSREGGFGAAFRARTGGAGVDVVLNSLTGELLDESAALLRPDGVFVEMGRTDLRPAAEFPGRYVPFDLGDAGPDRLGAILGEVVGLLAAGELPRPSVTAWDVAAAPTVLQHMSRGAHVGKLVLTRPAPLRADGTVLVTGGTGTLGRLVARHLVVEHGVRRLLLAGRRGPQAPGAGELRAELEGLGATVDVVACDVADGAALAALLDRVPPEHALTGVVHAAGVLADGLVTSVDDRAVEEVLRAKVDAAHRLDELTAGDDLAFFVLFSSAASVLAGPGQGVYAAANGVLEALAAGRRARGLPATALGWGLWAETSELTGGLGDRLARTGITPLPTAVALALLDEALRSGEEVLYPLSVDRAVLRRAEFVPEVLRGAVRRRASSGTAAGSAGLVERLAGSGEAEQVAALSELVRSHAAAVVGFASADDLSERTAFKDVGFDSLAAVELRNRLGTATGVRLPSTLVFDHPTPMEVAERLRADLFAGREPAAGVDGSLSELERLLDSLPVDDLPDDVGERLSSLLRTWNDRRPARADDALPVIDDDTSDDELFSALDRRLGSAEDAG